MSLDFDYFTKKFPRSAQLSVPRVAQADLYLERLPPAWTAELSSDKLGGYSQGLLWLTDPTEYVPAVAEWLEKAGIPDPEKFSVIARSAFGDLYLWEKSSGPTVIIHSLSGSIVTQPADQDVLDGDEDFALEGFLVSLDKEGLDFFDINDKPLFKRAVAKLGTLAADEMYGFEPALPIGGLPKLENLTKVKIAAHLSILAQLTDIEITHIDVDNS